MLEHLIAVDKNIPELPDLTGAEIISAKRVSRARDPKKTPPATECEIEEAQTAFTLLAEEMLQLPTGTPPKTAQRVAQQLGRGSALAHLDAMLTAYDWDFVTKAKEIRNYTVGKLLEIAESGSERGKLKSLELLGKVTEIGLFTHRLEITTKSLDDNTLEAVLREKLQKYASTEVSFREVGSDNT